MADESLDAERADAETDHGRRDDRGATALKITLYLLEDCFGRDAVIGVP